MFHSVIYEFGFDCLRRVRICVMFDGMFLFFYWEFDGETVAYESNSGNFCCCCCYGTWGAGSF